ncbi:unnamed protein product [Pseudo-nitzschia multistriata]|uniref:PSI domain-containing protein n=1 Tax=Pseudo-nitzschia multistriata TaxID=183589 RepID=A0A448ZHN4_9STRA|nr:unnamed protein product [Pseudo-nitzschia multistriata]
MAPTMAPTKAITKTPTKDPTPVPTIVPTATPTKARSTKTPTTTAPSANMISVKDTSTTSPSTNTPDISDSLTSNLDLVATDPCPGFADDCSRCVANPACSWCLETSVCFNANVEIEAAPVQNGDGSSIIARKFENQCFGTMTQLVSACPISSQNPSLGETEGGNYKATNLDADVDAEGNVGPDTNADDTLKGTHETTTSSSTAMNLDAANDENVDTDANARASFEGINETTDIAQSSSSSINTAGMLLASGVCCIATVLAMRHM